MKLNLIITAKGVTKLKVMNKKPLSLPCPMNYNVAEALQVGKCNHDKKQIAY